MLGQQINKIWPSQYNMLYRYGERYSEVTNACVKQTCNEVVIPVSKN